MPCVLHDDERKLIQTALNHALLFLKPRRTATTEDKAPLEDVPLKLIRSELEHDRTVGDLLCVS